MNTIMNYIVKSKEIFIGLEDSKKTWKVCVRSDKIVIHETSMPAEYEVFKNYLNNRFPDCTIHVIYEAGFRGFELHDQLAADGYNCIVTPPHTVTQEKTQRQKNDRIDCRRLARNLESGDYHICYVPSRKLREDRQFSRLYDQLKRDINRECNRIRRTLEYHGIDREFGIGAWNRADYIRVNKSIAEMDLSPSLKLSLNIMFTELFNLWELQRQVLKELYKLGKSEPYKSDFNLLKSAPGIGLLTAIRLVLEWGDLTRFTRKEEFSSFLGLIPSDYSSGENEHKGHITKQGNGSIRSLLIECSWIAIRHDPVLLEKFTRVARSSGSKKKAIVAVARKLANRLRSVLQNKTPYTIGLVH